MTIEPRLEHGWILETVNIDTRYYLCYGSSLHLGFELRIQRLYWMVCGLSLIRIKIMQLICTIFVYNQRFEDAFGIGNFLSKALIFVKRSDLPISYRGELINIDPRIQDALILKIVDIEIRYYLLLWILLESGIGFRMQQLCWRMYGLSLIIIKRLDLFCTISVYKQGFVDAFGIGNFLCVASIFIRIFVTNIISTSIID